MGGRLFRVAAGTCSSRSAGFERRYRWSLNGRRFRCRCWGRRVLCQSGPGGKVRCGRRSRAEHRAILNRWVEQHNVLAAKPVLTARLKRDAHRRLVDCRAAYHDEAARVRDWFQCDACRAYFRYVPAGLSSGTHSSNNVSSGCTAIGTTIRSGSPRKDCSMIASSDMGSAGVATQPPASASRNVTRRAT